MKKALALTLALVLTVLCTACGAITVTVPIDAVPGLAGMVGNTTPAADNGAETPATEAPATQAPADSTAPASDATATTAASSDATTAPAATTPAATQAASNGVPSSKDEIIAYYVKAYNKIGSDNGKITRTYDYTSNYNSILHINDNATLEKLANSLMNQFMVESTDPLETSFADLPPKGVTNLAISPSQISSATIADNGSTYTVVLKSTGTDDKYEVDAQPGTSSAGVVGPLLRTEDVSSAAGSLLKFDGLHAWYATATVTATIDKASGRIVALDYLTPCILHFDQVTVAILKVANCDIGLLFQQKYTIAY